MGEPADPELSPLGHRQAKLTADFLECESIQHVASSTMLRAHQTAKPLVDRLGIELSLHDELREVDDQSNRYVPMEDLLDDDPIVTDLRDDPWSLFNGNFEGFRSRVVSAFDHLIEVNKGRTVAVFCHGMVMGVYAMTLLGTDDPFRFPVDYCGIMRVQASSTGIRTLRSTNETGHVRHTLD